MITLGFEDPFLEPQNRHYFARAVGTTSESPGGWKPEKLHDVSIRFQNETNKKRKIITSKKQKRTGPDS